MVIRYLKYEVNRSPDIIIELYKGIKELIWFEVSNILKNLWENILLLLMIIDKKGG